jgi:hypothetical protein
LKHFDSLTVVLTKDGDAWIAQLLEADIFEVHLSPSDALSWLAHRISTEGRYPPLPEPAPACEWESLRQRVVEKLKGMDV